MSRTGRTQSGKGWVSSTLLLQLIVILLCSGLVQSIIRAPPPVQTKPVERDLDMRRFERALIYAVIKNDYPAALAMLRFGVDPHCHGLNRAEAAEIGLHVNLIDVPPIVLVSKLHGFVLGEPILRAMAQIDPRPLPRHIVPESFQTNRPPNPENVTFPEDLQVNIDPTFCEEFPQFCLKEFEEGYPMIPQIVDAAYAFNNSVYLDIVHKFMTDDTFKEPTLAGRTLLHEAVHFGNIYMLSQLLNHSQVVPDAPSGHHGLTPLHHSLYSEPKHRYTCLQLLLDAGADMSKGDLHGRTPFMHAVILGDVKAVEMMISHASLLGINDQVRAAKDSRGHTASDLLSWSPWRKADFAALFPDTDWTYQSPQFDGERAEHTARDGGWIPHFASALDAPPGHSMSPVIDVIDAHDLTVASFIQDYMSLRRPVVLRNAVDTWPAWDYWTPSELRNLYGDVRVVIGASPSAVNFAPRSGDAVYTRLRRYLEYIQTARATYDDDSAPHKLGPKNYTQDAPWVMDTYEILTNKTDFLLDFYPPPYFRICSTPRMPEFGVGPVASGSKFRQHGHAYMSIVYGQRRVFLVPGSSEEYYTVQDRNFKAGHILYLLGDRPGTSWPVPREQVIEVLLQPGDTLYIPEGWSEAYLNTAETVSLTQEFCDTAQTQSGGDGQYGAEQLLLRRLIHQQPRTFVNEMPLQEQV